MSPNTYTIIHLNADPVSTTIVERMLKLAGAREEIISVANVSQLITLLPHDPAHIWLLLDYDTIMQADPAELWQLEVRRMQHTVKTVLLCFLDFDHVAEAHRLCTIDACFGKPVTPLQIQKYLLQLYGADYLVQSQVQALISLKLQQEVLGLLACFPLQKFSHRLRDLLLHEKNQDTQPAFDFSAEELRYLFRFLDCAVSER